MVCNKRVFSMPGFMPDHGFNSSMNDFFCGHEGVTVSWLGDADSCTCCDVESFSMNGDELAASKGSLVECRKNCVSGKKKKIKMQLTPLKMVVSYKDQD